MTPHILIVDDENTLRYFLKRTLEAEGYRVSEAADGQTALSLLERETFDVALVEADALLLIQLHTRIPMHRICEFR